MGKEKIQTIYKDKQDNPIFVGDEYFISPAWSSEDLYCKVIDQHTIRWKKKTTLNTSLSYWASYLIKS